jgi:hypothetical protein
VQGIAKSKSAMLAIAEEFCSKVCGLEKSFPHET